MKIRNDKGCDFEKGNSEIENKCIETEIRNGGKCTGEGKENRENREKIYEQSLKNIRKQ